jgi:hypothetical protein
MISRSLLLLCSAAVAAAAAQADDPIAKKLQAAKAAYETRAEKGRTAVREWFDKRENAARKDGNKKVVDQIKAERARFDQDGELPKAAPPELGRDLADARAALEEAYSTAIRDYTRARMDDQAAAVEKQLEAFRRGRPRAADDPLADALTPELLKAKFMGKAAFDKKTGTLELTYRFADRKELEDFECSDIPPKLSGGGAILVAGQSIKHVVEFDSVTVAGLIGMRNMKGMALTTTGGTQCGTGGANNDTIYLTPKGRQTTQLIVAERFRRGTIRFGVIITDKRVTFAWGNDQLGGESAEPGVGRVVLHGGDTGFAFGNVVLKGKVNRAWAEKFFDIPGK